MSIFRFKRQQQNNRAGDDPVIHNYDPEEGLPEVPKIIASLKPGKAVCPTCLGKKKIKGAIPILDDQQEVTGLRRMTIDCPDCSQFK